MTTLADVTAAFAAEVRRVTGLRDAAADPPEQLNALPAAVVYVRGGSWKVGPPELMTGLIDIVVEVHVARKDLPRDVKQAQQFSVLIPKAIFSALRKHSLGVVQTFGDVSFTFGPLGWGQGTGAQETFGYRFVVERVKVQLPVEA